MEKNTLKILLVVSFIVVLFGGMSVYLALKVKDLEAQETTFKERITTLESQLKDCQ